VGSLFGASRRSILMGSFAHHIYLCDDVVGGFWGWIRFDWRRLLGVSLAVVEHATPSRLRLLALYIRWTLSWKVGFSVGDRDDLMFGIALLQKSAWRADVPITDNSGGVSPWKIAERVLKQDRVSQIKLSRQRGLRRLTSRASNSWSAVRRALLKVAKVLEKL